MAGLVPNKAYLGLGRLLDIQGGKAWELIGGEPPPTPPPPPPPTPTPTPIPTPTPRGAPLGGPALPLQPYQGQGPSLWARRDAASIAPGMSPEMAEALLAESPYREAILQRTAVSSMTTPGPGLVGGKPPPTAPPQAPPGTRGGVVYWTDVPPLPPSEPPNQGYEWQMQVMRQDVVDKFGVKTGEVKFGYVWLQQPAAKPTEEALNTRWLQVGDNWELRNDDTGELIKTIPAAEVKFDLPVGEPLVKSEGGYDFQFNPSSNKWDIRIGTTKEPKETYLLPAGQQRSFVDASGYTWAWDETTGDYNQTGYTKPADKPVTRTRGYSDGTALYEQDETQDPVTGLWSPSGAPRKVGPDTDAARLKLSTDIAARAAAADEERLKLEWGWLRANPRAIALMQAMEQGLVPNLMQPGQQLLPGQAPTKPGTYEPDVTPVWAQMPLVAQGMRAGGLVPMGTAAEPVEAAYIDVPGVGRIHAGAPDYGKYLAQGYQPVVAALTAAQRAKLTLPTVSQWGGYSPQTQAALEAQLSAWGFPTQTAGAAPGQAVSTGWLGGAVQALPAWWQQQARSEPSYARAVAANIYASNVRRAEAGAWADASERAREMAGLAGQLRASRVFWRA